MVAKLSAALSGTLVSFGRAPLLGRDRSGWFTLHIIQKAVNIGKKNFNFASCP